MNQNDEREQSERDVLWPQWRAALSQRAEVPQDAKRTVRTWMQWIAEAYQARDDIRDSGGWTPRQHELRLIEEKMVAALAAAPQPQRAEVPPAPFVHKKTGGKYQFVGNARLQTATALSDMAYVVVYRGEDGHLWVRASDEFTERFYQEAAPKPQQASGEQDQTRPQNWSYETACEVFTGQAPQPQQAEQQRPCTVGGPCVHTATSSCACRELQPQNAPAQQANMGIPMTLASSDPEGHRQAIADHEAEQQGSSESLRMLINDWWDRLPCHFLDAVEKLDAEQPRQMVARQAIETRILELANELDAELNGGARWTKAQHTCNSVSSALRDVAREVADLEDSANRLTEALRAEVEAAPFEPAEQPRQMVALKPPSDVDCPICRAPCDGSAHGIAPGGKVVGNG